MNDYAATRRNASLTVLLLSPSTSCVKLDRRNRGSSPTVKEGVSIHAPAPIVGSADYALAHARATAPMVYALAHARATAPMVYALDHARAIAPMTGSADYAAERRPLISVVWNWWAGQHVRKTLAVSGEQ